MKTATPDLITVILDKSGSMNRIADATLDGLNEFIEGQIASETPTRWSLVLFDHEVSAAFTNIPGAEMQPLTRSDYRPGGSTALYDAVAMTLLEMERRIEAEEIAHEGVVIAILTDGHENASTHHSMNDVAKLIRRAEDRDWQFIFLGANQDSWAVGRQIGINRGSYVDFAAAPESVKESFRAAGDITRSYRTDRVAHSEYRDTRKKEK